MFMTSADSDQPARIAQADLSLCWSHMSQGRFLFVGICIFGYLRTQVFVITVLQECTYVFNLIMKLVFYRP